MCDITLAPAAQKALDMHTKTGSAAMAERGIQVRATAMSGHQVDLLLGAEEPIALLRQKVSEALGIRKWQLRLIHGAMVLNDGGLIKELVAETETNETVEVMALAVEAIEVKERSKELFSIFKRRIRTQHFHIDAINRINRHEEAILNGEVAFDYLGDNMLELLLNNWPSGAIERPMSLLLAGGACVNSPSNDGYTPLLIACSRGLGEEANLLLEHGASPRQHLPNGDDALISALKFFQACSEVNARSRQEDLHLGWTCCILRAAHIRSATGLLPLEEARLKLSQAGERLAWDPRWLKFWLSNDVL